MGKIENLKPWQPGQSGNPGGRPKRDAITAALREQLESQANDGDNYTIADAVAATLIKQALGGDVRAIREIADRVEGKPRQQLEIEARAFTNDQQLDLSRLTDEQLRQLGELFEIAEGTGNNSKLS